MCSNSNDKTEDRGKCRDSEWKGEIGADVSLTFGAGSDLGLVNKDFV